MKATQAPMIFKRIIGCIENILEIVPGGVFGLLSVLIGVSGDIIASTFIPEYSIFLNMISDLGVGPGGIYFNVGVFISGLVAIPFDIHLGNTFKEEKYNGKLSIVAIYASVISSIALSMVGVFPANQDMTIIFFLHGTFAMISFLAGATYLIFFGYFMLSDKRFPNVFSYYSFILAVLFIVVILSWIPIIEWIANFGIISWTIIMGVYLIQKKI